MHEFMKALYELGLEASEGAIAAVFQTFDPNGDGQIEYSEMHDLLVRSVQSHPKLEPLDVKATNRLKLRKKRVRKQDANLLQGGPAFRLETDSLDSFPQQLRKALHRRLLRAVDLFRQFDDDGNGCISQHELAKAMTELGLHVPLEVGGFASSARLAVPRALSTGSTY